MHARRTARILIAATVAVAGVLAVAAPTGAVDDGDPAAVAPSGRRAGRSPTR